MGKYQANAILSGRSDINKELALINISLKDKSPIIFKPGQYVELAHIDINPETGLREADSILRRQYSIASASDQGVEIELYIVLVNDGVFTSKLWQLDVGSEIWMNPKVKGKFTLEEVPSNKDLVMISTGTGIAPFMSMLRSFRDKNRWRRFVMIHGARYQHDLGYRKELENLHKTDESIFYIPTLTREPEGSDYQGHRGRVQSIFDDGTYESIVGEAFRPSNCQIFLCGNPDMIDTTQLYLENKGFKLHKKKHPGQIHVEKYW